MHLSVNPYGYIHLPPDVGEMFRAKFRVLLHTEAEQQDHGDDWNGITSCFAAVPSAAHS